MRDSDVHHFIIRDQEETLVYECFWCGVEKAQPDGAVCEKRFEAKYFGEVPF